MIFVLLFGTLSIPVKLFSQEDTLSQEEILKVKCPVCGYENTDKDVFCRACGALLKTKEEAETLGVKIPVRDTVKAKSKKYLGFKIYVPMEKEIFVAGGNILPMTYGIGGGISFEKVDRFGMSWGIDVEYYRAWNNTTVYFYDYAGEYIGYTNLEYGYDGLKVDFTYKWKGMKIPFWIGAGAPIWVGRAFAKAEELETSSNISVFGAGGEFSVGADLPRKSDLFLSPEIKVQLIPFYYSVEGTHGRSFLLSIQMQVGLNIKI